MALVFGGLPEELQGCCAGYLDTTSAGRFGQANRACSRLVEGQLAAAKAVRAAAPFEKTRHGNCITYRNPTDSSKLLTFSMLTDGGLQRTQRYRCACRAGDFAVGIMFINVAQQATPGVALALEALAACRLRRGAADRD